MQFVLTRFGVSKNDLAIACAHALAAGDGLPYATCATLGMVTTVAFRSVRAT